MVLYSCPRCGYQTNHKGKFKIHLERKNICAAIHSNMQIEEIKEYCEQESSKKSGYACENCQKVFKTSQSKYQHKQRCKDTIIDKRIKAYAEEVQKLTEIIDLERKQIRKLQQDNKRLQIKYLFLKSKKNESYYQAVLEEMLQGTHKKLLVGETDITTDAFHAEIKQWDCWKESIGQLCSYKSCDPKDELRVYLFGKYNEENKKNALEVFKNMNIKAFECIDKDEGLAIKDLSTNDIVMSWVTPVNDDQVDDSVSVI